MSHLGSSTAACDNRAEHRRKSPAAGENTDNVALCLCETSVEGFSYLVLHCAAAYSSTSVPSGLDSLTSGY